MGSWRLMSPCPHAILGCFRKPVRERTAVFWRAILGCFRKSVRERPVFWRAKFLCARCFRGCEYNLNVVGIAAVYGVIVLVGCEWFYKFCILIHALFHVVLNMCYKLVGFLG